MKIRAAVDRRVRHGRLTDAGVDEVELIAATLAAGILGSGNTAVSPDENGARIAVEVYRQVLAVLKEAHDADHPTIDWKKEVMGRPITVRSTQDRRAG